MPYIGNSPSAGVRQRYQYTATGGQTTFSGADTGNLTLNYTDNNFVDVFQNGVLLKGGTTDYTATSGTSVVLTTGASVSDVIEIIVYDVFSVGNFYSRTDSDSRYYKHSLGEELILDADGDTSITADTDDQIDIRIGGSDKVTINSSGRVGIGTTDIDAPLDIVDGTEYIRISNTADDATNKSGGLAIRHKTNSEEDFNIITGICGGSSNVVNIGGSDFIGNLNCATQIAFFTGANQTTLNGTSRMTINSSGLITSPPTSSNTTGSSANMHVTSGGEFAKSTSSRRYKNTINDATHGLADLLKLRSVTFKGNNDGDTVFGGLIAEEVHDAGLTEFVVYDDDNKPDALHYTHMVALCVKSIQELSAKNDALEARIKKLEDG